jgi:hypothetical protein
VRFIVKNRRYFNAPAIATLNVDPIRYSSVVWQLTLRSERKYIERTVHFTAQRAKTGGGVYRAQSLQITKRNKR